ncbi:MAG TPA: DNA polymerase III subunit alpha [Candidatus Paceibacterota bacterium]|nr:DNA polymerase III subunit alpha [Candidatus Paceibacterota bacterium]
MYFTHLHLHSHYSLLDGLPKIEEILQKAKEVGFDSLALTDHGVLYGALEFYIKAKELGIKPIIGCELYLAPRTLHDKVPKVDTKFYHLPVLVKNIEGYKNLLQLVTIGELEGFYYKPRVDKEVLKKYSKGLIALSGCLRGEICQALLANSFSRAKELLEEYQNIFGKENFYLELQDHSELEEQKKVNDLLIQLANETKTPAVVTCDSHYLNLEDKRTHEVLLAVQTGTGIEDEERFTMKKTDLHLKTKEEVEKNFNSYPQIFENIKKIVDSCNLELELGKITFPKFETPNNEDHFEYLKKLTYEGFNKIYKNDVQAKERLDYELEVIKQTNFADYFLIIHDFIKFAEENGILTNTRGSAAGSLVAYALNITRVDPLKFELYFERFLNPERIQPPDIDVDVADNRRQDLIDYLISKYGKDHVAQIITFGFMKARLAVRDVNRALGYPYSLGDRIAKLIPFNMSAEEALKTVPELKELYETDFKAKEVLDISQKLEGVARHASTHAAGVVITSEKLTSYVPLQHSSRNEEEIITQYNMYDLEKIGLIKMDILGLKNLTVIKNSLRIIKKVYDREINLDEIGFDDKEVFNLLSSGQTIGVFQVESEGMRRYLKELKPTNIEDVTAMLALYRPGPMELIPQFIKRKQKKEPITYLHPKLKPILEKTYGICVYQEQLMRIAHDLAGFSMAEADVLRKAVGKKIKKLLEAQKEKMIEGMKQNEIPEKIAFKIWEWVKPFARYGFNKGHSASYARITYQTAWLKAHYPNAFMAALLTSDFGDLDRIAIEIGECERLNIKVLPPSVNSSFVEFGIDKETKEIYFSLAAIKNVGVGVAQAIQEERQKNGLFQSLADFLKRLDRQLLNRKTLESLMKSGALDCFGSRELMVENLDEILNWANHNFNHFNHPQLDLFGETNVNILEKLKKEKGEPPVDRLKRVNWEREYLGLYLTIHPLEGYQKVLAKYSFPLSKIDFSMIGKKIKIGGFISQIQKIRTKTGQNMVFLKLSDNSRKMEIVFFPRALKENQFLLAEDKVVLVEGKLDKRNGDFQLIGEKIEEIKPLEA